eukprot:7136782-Prymnesium_polylepis.1
MSKASGFASKLAANKLLEKHRRRQQHRPRLQWETAQQDFVYAVALAPSMKYCAVGGVSNNVTILDLHTGSPLLTHSTSGTV